MFWAASQVTAAEPCMAASVFHLGPLLVMFGGEHTANRTALGSQVSHQVHFPATPCSSPVGH